MEALDSGGIGGGGVTRSRRGGGRIGRFGVVCAGLGDRGLREQRGTR